VVAAGIVLTGGTSRMEGVIELAEEIFHMPVRIGVPQHVNGLQDIVRNPIYATGVGLLQYAVRKQLDEQANRPSRPDSGPGVFSQVKGWLQKHF